MNGFFSQTVLACLLVFGGRGKEMVRFRRKQIEIFLENKDFFEIFWQHKKYFQFVKFHGMGRKKRHLNSYFANVPYKL